MQENLKAVQPDFWQAGRCREELHFLHWSPAEGVLLLALSLLQPEHHSCLGIVPPEQPCSLSGYHDGQAMLRFPSVITILTLLHASLFAL